ncbi:major facilitator superfamily domain-containing protein [Gamsiella multidivaricata]|uniref:major facilitator superfamily domain-containing protein n=1 Tax=Gamsiella multidivaricata TaxID=101098 RepID=UPI00221F2A3A|nr:major facilitator superfamily domain-containing protein [Gamsiella multidivaricata]KAI7826996.1 major facilitator superfamily domain-containing protein [Gamsiella multidivaricata]
MDLSDEQTPLISSHRNSISSNRLGRGRGGFYSNERNNFNTTATVTPPQSDPLPRPRPQRLLQAQFIQNLDRNYQHERSHIITRRHWLVLLLACLLLYGNYYCYHIPAALNVQLKEWLGTDYATHQYHLNLLYSAYSLPNIVLPLLGGFLIDRLSAARMLLLFSLCVCAGQGIFAIGVSEKSIWTMVLGRLIFGIGGECLEVAQAKITTDWFKARWLGFALGLSLSSARVATAMNDNISPAIATHGGGVVGASWVGFGVCGLSLVCGLWLTYLDRTDSRRSAGVRSNARDRKTDRIRSRRDNIVGRQAINVSSDSTMTMSSVALEEEDEIEKENEMAEDDQVLYSETFTLQTNFWILCLCCISLYGAVIPFIHVSSDFLQKKWYPDDPRKAGAVMSIPYIVSSVGSPLCGYIVDRFGNRARYIPLSAVLLIWAHMQLGFTLFTPVCGMLVLGLAYSLFASVLWPCIPFLVKDHQLGTAYGLVTIALNFSLTLFPMAVASILHATKGSYRHVEGLLIVLAFIGLLLSILLNVLNHHKGGYLQLTGEPVPSGPQYLDEDYEERLRREHREQLQRLDHYDPREPGFEYRRQMRYSQELLQEEDPDIEDIQDMVTTKPVGEGIITLIPHRRRDSIASFTGYLGRARLRHYTNHAQTAFP